MRDALVVGAGPVGLLVAGELTRRGLDVEVLERRPEVGHGTRAIGVHAPALAALEASGVTERLLAHALRVPRGEARAAGRTLGTVRFDRMPVRFPFVATLPQSATEAVLAAHSPPPVRDAVVRRVVPVDGGVRVHADIADRPTEMSARLVVIATGAGGRALAYRPGGLSAREHRDRYLMADLPTDGHPDAEAAIVHLSRDGVLESFPLPGGMRRFVAWDDPRGDADPAARVARLRHALAIRGEAVAAGEVREAAAFGIRRVVAPAVRRGRIFVIGDAAHEVSPIGGQGMNLGLLDAVGLAPLLAEWSRSGAAPDTALRAWERRRVASARTAARLAAANTLLGRPLPGAGDLARRIAVRAMLAPGPNRLFAHAYAMGLDAGA